MYVMGGTGSSSELATVEEYDPVMDAWTARAPMTYARGALGAATGSNGRIYAIGGDNRQGYVGPVEEYDPTTNTWTVKASLPTLRDALGVAAASNGKLYAVGGTSDVNGGLVVRNTVEEYDPTTDTWRTRASIRDAREYPGVAAATNGKLYVIGGERGRFSSPTYLSSVEEGTLP